MAKFQVVGFDAFAADLEAAKSLSKPEQRRVINAGAEIVKTQMKQTVAEIGLIDSGALRDSIAIEEKTSGGEPVAQIYPKGKHHVAHGRSGGKRGKGAAYDVDAAEVGFVHEYGAPSRRIPARHWMEGSVDRVEKSGELTETMQAEFDAILDEKGAGQ